MAETTEKRAQKPRDVNYTLQVVDDLPDLDVQRRSPLEDQIEKIISEERVHGRYVQIGDYANGSAASAAANVLRKRHGDKAAVEGFEVRVRRADVGDQTRTGLFVKYDPAQIVEGERDEFDKRMKDREAKTLKRRTEREAAEGNGQGNASNTPSQPTPEPSPEPATPSPAPEPATPAPTSKTPREKNVGPGQSSGTAEAAKKNAPEDKQ